MYNHTNTVVNCNALNRQKYNTAVDKLHSV